ncbi:MAG: response regulator [Lentimicrobium sp.]|nr:response regulator [Lentimicrobium sp.]
MPDLLKVLLIDDNPDDRILIIRELRKLFIIDVEEIIDSSGFDNALSRLDFDIVITDYQLRWTNGIEVLIKIKTIKPLLPVIMFTGTGSEEIAVLAMKIGLDDYILKLPDHYVRLAMSVNTAILRMQDELRRVQAEIALTKSEENYRTLVENIGIGFTRLDKDFKIIMVNEAQGRMFQRDPKDFQGMKCCDLYDTQLMSCPCTGEQTFQQNITPRESLTYGIRSDKSVFEVQVRTFPSFDGNGNVSGFIEITEDISARLKSERIQEVAYNIANAAMNTDNLQNLLKAIVSELERIIDTSGLSVVLFDQDSDRSEVIFSSIKSIDSDKKLLRRSLSELVIKRETSILLKRSEIDALQFSGEIDTVSQELKVWMGIPLKIQKQIFGALVLENFENENAVIDSDLNILQFVSNQIAIAIDNKRGADRLRESELKFRSLVEQSTEGIVIIDRDGFIIEWNPAMAEISMISASEAIGKPIWDLQYELEDLKHKDDQYLLRLKKAFVRIIASFDNNISLLNDGRIKTRSGKLKVLQLSLFPARFNGSVNVGAFVRDITIERNAAEEISKAKRKAEESNKLKTAFLTNISHEVRTPLNAIVGFASLLSEPGQSDKDRIKFSEQIFENSVSLLNQFNNIIDISKIESGSLSLNCSSFGIDKFMDSIVQQAKIRIAKAGVEFRQIKPSQSGQMTLYSDQEQLKQVLNQLLINAFKFTDSGYVEISYEQTGLNTVSFIVKDTGPGIPEDKIDFIFELFRQGDDNINRKYMGMGVGLNIVKKIVTLLNGEVQYKSNLPQGSIFTIVIPISALRKEKEMENIQIENIASTTDKWIGKTILIVEDVESNYQFLAATLRRSGANLIWVKQGEEAIALVENGQKLDLVLMDVQLAGIDGYEVTKQIKLMRADLPVIAQTAFAMIGEKLKSQEAGCDDYLAKPIRPSLLLQTISKYL